MKFHTIVVDPPWLYEQKYRMGSGKKHKGTADGLKFQCMSIEELEAVRISSVAEVDAHLYVWCTNSFVVEAHHLARRWGFETKCLITWVKPYFGTGNYFRSSTEHVVFAVRGRLPLLKHNVPTHFFAPKQPRLAAKPNQFYEIVKSCSPPEYLDVFARRERLGWYSIGNEIDGLDVNAALRDLASVPQPG